jgi:hypothetical protein
VLLWLDKKFGVSSELCFAPGLQMLLNKGELEGVRVLRDVSVRTMLTDQLPPALLPFELGGFKGWAFG